jgi:hypothetical protein
VRIVAGRLVASAVAAQIRDDDGEVLCKPRRDVLPHHSRLRIAMEQQERRPVAADERIDLDAMPWQSLSPKA